MAGGGYCASELNIDSNGIQREKGRSLLGAYKYYSVSNGRPSFKHTREEYYLRWTTNNNWMAGISSLGK